MRFDNLFNTVYNRARICANIEVRNMDDRLIGHVPLGEHTLIPVEGITGHRRNPVATAIYTIVPVDKDNVIVYISQWESGAYEDTLIFTTLGNKIKIPERNEEQ